MLSPCKASCTLLSLENYYKRFQAGIVCTPLGSSSAQAPWKRTGALHSDGTSILKMPEQFIQILLNYSSPTNRSHLRDEMARLIKRAGLHCAGEVNKKYCIYLKCKGNLNRVCS